MGISALTVLSSWRSTVFAPSFRNVMIGSANCVTLVPKRDRLARPDVVLLRAAQIVLERGLCQGAWRPGGSLCAAGAIGEAAEERGLTREMMEIHLLRLAGSLGGSDVRDVHAWNDEPGRKAPDVVEALQLAAYGL
jgi:hypothetical protein